MSGHTWGIGVDGSECCMDCSCGPPGGLSCPGPSARADWIVDFAPVLPPTTFITIGGREIDLLRPDPAKIEIEDIAHALSMICRFGGHLPVFYSVAQHSYEAALRMDTGHRPGCASDRRVRFACLLHDAAEGLGLGDVISPQKRALKSSVQVIESRLEDAIAIRFELRPEELHDQRVRLADRRMFTTECRDLRGGLMPRPALGDPEAEPYGPRIFPEIAEIARARFMNAFAALSDAGRGPAAAPPVQP